MSLARAVTAIALLVVSGGLGGCFFPEDGPSSAEIRFQAQEPSAQYALVPLTENVVDELNKSEPEGLSGAFHDRRPPSVIKLGIGDTVSVTVFESAAGGLFIPVEAGIRPGNFVSLPDQVVDNKGNITVPYAGEIAAAGRTNVDVQKAIVNKLKERAIEPQVIVSVSQQRTNLVSVLGEVNSPVRYPASLAGANDRLTDAITRAGGIKAQGYESWVMLERDNRRATVPFGNLVMYPSNNIYVQPGDRIYVYKEPQRFVAFGAAGQQGEFYFDAWRVNLTSAVAKAGGLMDAQADPGSVFLFRPERREVAERLGVDMSKFPGNRTVPVVLSVNFRDPGQFFLARQVQMRNQDVIFVANAESVQFTKFLNFVNVGLLAANNATLGTSFGVFAKYNLGHRIPIAP